MLTSTDPCRGRQGPAALVGCCSASNAITSSAPARCSLVVPRRHPVAPNPTPRRDASFAAQAVARGGRRRAAATGVKQPRRSWPRRPPHAVTRAPLRIAFVRNPPDGLRPHWRPKRWHGRQGSAAKLMIAFAQLERLSRSPAAGEMQGRSNRSRETSRRIKAGRRLVPRRRPERARSPGKAGTSDWLFTATQPRRGRLPRNWREAGPPPHSRLGPAGRRTRAPGAHRSRC